VDFEIGRDVAGSAMLVLRVPNARQRILVSVDGGEPRAAEILPQGSGTFLEAAVAELPAGTKPAHVRFETAAPPGATPLVLFHVFSLAPGPG
jgi:hypothetical protein